MPDSPPPSSSPSSRAWIGPLLAILVAQIAISFLARIAPTLAPELALRMHWEVTDIGLLSAALALGTALFMLAGLPLVLRAGPVRALQGGLLVGGAATLMYIVPLAGWALFAALLIGLASGPMASAGSDVLRRYAPAGQQNLVFSLKQAGVPIAGVLAGLLLPWLALRVGVDATLALSALLMLVTLAAIQPLRRQLDAGRDPRQSVHLLLLLSPGNLQRPLRALWQDPNLLRVALSGACFGIGQGVWFTFLVSHLVVHRGLSLAAAGALFALMQLVSTIGRPLLGWIADRAGAGRVLRITCIGSGIATLALAALSPAWPAWSVLLLVLLGGGTVSSWNGVQGAQAVYYARPGAVGEAATGSILLIMLANVVGPVLFGLMAALGGFPLGFVVAALLTLAGWWPLRRLP